MNILVYGASGRIGELVAQSLREQGYSLRLGGRDPERLKRVAGPDDAICTGSFQEMAKEVGVVANCAPLHQADTDDLVRAAISQGAHYVDLAGEQSLIRHLHDTHHQAALAAGVCVVGALGFDYAVGDCLARLVAADRDCEEIVVAYAFEEGEAADNSLDFATSGPRGEEVVYRGGRWTKVPLEFDWTRFNYPPPFGRQQVARYGSGEVVTVPTHSRTRHIRTYITASSLVPHPFLLPVFPILRPLVAMALKTPLRHLIRWAGVALAKLRPSPPPKENASPTKGPAFAVVVEARTEGGHKTRASASGNDCHETTCRVLVHGVKLLAQNEHRTTGAVSPAVAFAPEAFLDELHPSLSWYVEDIE